MEINDAGLFDSDEKSRKVCYRCDSKDIKEKPSAASSMFNMYECNKCGARFGRAV